MKALIVGIVVLLLSILIIFSVLRLGLPIFYAIEIKLASQWTVSLKGRYEGIPEFPDPKPTAAFSYDVTRLANLSDLYLALEEFKKNSPTKSYPANAQEYLMITKYLRATGNKLRKDPVTNSDYCFTTDSNGKSYTLTTIFQSPTLAKKNNTETSQSCTFPEGMKVICSAKQKCYQTKSPF